MSDVLLSKYPDAMDVELNAILRHITCPALINANASEENAETVAKRVSGSAGPIGVDSVSFSHWLLKFGGASSLLRRTITDMVEWLANACPPWAS